MESAQTDRSSNHATKGTGHRRFRLAVPVALVAGLVLGIGGVILWQNVRSSPTPPSPLQAQAPGQAYASPSLKSWNILIKPEYILPDMPHEKEPGQRKVLVDFQGQGSLPEGTPTSWTFHIPPGGNTGMTCAIDTQGRHFMTSAQTVPGTPYDTVQFVSTQPGFHMALSYPAPALEAEELVFEYPLVPVYPVDDMTVSIQQPPLAQNFSVEQENVPNLEYSTERKGEFTYHRYRLLEVEPSKKMLFRIRYALSEAARHGPVQVTAKDLPAFAYNSAESLHGYRIARRIADVLHVMPCYCGCDGAAKHKNLRDCFINAAKGEYDSHASGCDLCSKIAMDVDRLIQNRSIKETRALIERQYSEYGKGTPTPPI